MTLNVRAECNECGADSGTTLGVDEAQWTQEGDCGVCRLEAEQEDVVACLPTGEIVQWLTAAASEIKVVGIGEAFYVHFYNVLCTRSGLQWRVCSLM